MKKENWVFCPDCKTLTPLKKVKIGDHIFLVCKVCNRIYLQIKDKGEN